MKRIIILVIIFAFVLICCKNEKTSKNITLVEDAEVFANDNEPLAFRIYGNELLTSFDILDSFYLRYPAWSYEFNNNDITYWAAATLKDPEINLKGIYNIENVNGVKYLNIEWDNNQKERHLIIYNNNLCYLYKNDDYMHFQGFRITNAMPGEGCASVDRDYIQIKSSSHLIENGVIYSTENLNEKLGICWAEGVPGYGINEKLSIETEGYPGVNSIHISIGYVSYNRSYLYDENSRPKRIELTVENKYSIIIDLDDTSNFQTIALPETLNRNEILELKIIEVYRGTKYEDTCINMILLDSAIY